MRAEDANFESMMEGNDSILPTVLQEPLLSVTEREKQNIEKRASSSQLKSGRNHYHLVFFKSQNALKMYI